MTLFKQSIIDLVETTATGPVQVRLKKMIIDTDSNTETMLGFHRAVIDPGLCPEFAFSMLNDDLGRRGFGLVTTEDWDRVRRIVKVEHTKKVVDAYKEKTQ